MNTTSAEVHASEAAAAHPAGFRLGLSKRLAVRGTVIAAVVLAAGFAVPYIVLDRFYISMLFDGLVLAMLALSIGFLARHLGLISLGHTAFYGGAAYFVGMAVTHWGWSPLMAALFGLAGGTALALLMGLLVVRSSGMGFLMLTLALGQALYQLSIQRIAIPYTGAFDGLQITFSGDATFLGLSVAQMMNGALFWPVVWTALVLSTFALWAVGRSTFGTVLEGIRENEERMRFSGFNTYWPRVLAFTISGVVASLAGVFFALNAAYVSPEVLSFLKAGDALIAAIVGGLGLLLGPVLGALLYIVAQSRFNESGNLHLYTGIALIVVLMFLPGGILGGLSSLRRRLARRGTREDTK
ncbi:MAG TPA: branched-chain amino acid ABC transporter permease [Intrasporangium sp.]|uniref:branched-chain amino acid ABC transporter permease n=1 Tax=Intrasporangium sp. TaxID=1925024 RepID=UPI002D7907B5|nr:branched-chain amino acid ABC transporter permease [Intrasporangium sp.]HET7399884.1 branched-chain amino acid ABC transporter permease [Intrasporangium sp.]